MANLPAEILSMTVDAACSDDINVNPMSLLLTSRHFYYSAVRHLYKRITLTMEMLLGFRRQSPAAFKRAIHTFKHTTHLRIADITVLIHLARICQTWYHKKISWPELFPNLEFLDFGRDAALQIEDGDLYYPSRLQFGKTAIPWAVVRLDWRVGGSEEDGGRRSYSRWRPDHRYITRGVVALCTTLEPKGVVAIENSGETELKIRELEELHEKKMKLEELHKKKMELEELHKKNRALEELHKKKTDLPLSDDA